MFYVWKRVDGYVGTSTYRPPYSRGGKWGTPEDFEVMGEFEEWESARALLVEECSKVVEGVTN